jgi:phage gpG-like protein
MGKPGRAQGTMLIDSGALRGSVNQIVGPLSAEVGTALFYGKFHQFGTGPTGPNHIFSGIPARAFVGLAGGEEDEIKTVVETYIAKLVGD